MAATEKEKATKLAHELVAYIESEQSDLKASDKNLMLYGKAFMMFVC